MTKKIAIFFYLLGVGCALGRSEAPAAVPTGIIQLEDARYPVALLVPETYSPKVNYPLVVTIPSEGESPEKALAYWEGMSKRRSLIVMAPSNLRPEDLPTAMDAWILKVIREVSERYRIDKNSIYLFGAGGGAHYAAYLGTQHPEAFSAVALIGAAWEGRYQQLVRLRGDSSEQRPFLIYAPATAPKLLEALAKQAYPFEKKGYPVVVKKVGSPEELEKIEFKKELFEALETQNRDWRDFQTSHSQTLKARVRASVKEFFTV